MFFTLTNKAATGNLILFASTFHKPQERLRKIFSLSIPPEEQGVFALPKCF